MASKKAKQSTQAHKDRWTAIRVSTDTKQQLDEIRAIWQERADQTAIDGLGTLPIQSGRHATRDVIGLDQVVRRLIALWRRRIARAKRSKESIRNTKLERPGHLTKDQLRYRNAVRDLPDTVDYDPLGMKTMDDLRYACRIQLDLIEEGQDSTENDDPKPLRRWLKKYF